MTWKINEKFFQQARNRLHFQHLNGTSEIIKHCKETERHTCSYICAEYSFVYRPGRTRLTQKQRDIITVITLRINLMHCYFLKCIFVLNSILPFLKLLVFESSFGTSETFLRSVPTLQSKIVLLIDAHRLLILSVGTSLIPVTFYNNYVTFYISY
jgi:hypothetical protein